jgi:hypothetical protein
MDMDADLIIGWDCISSHDLHHLYADGHVRFRFCCSWTSSRRVIQVYQVPDSDVTATYYNTS